AAAGATLTALVRLRRPAWLAFPVMMASWLVGEAPRLHLLAQLLVLVAAGVGGVTATVPGRVGMAALAASVVGLVLVDRRARRAPLGAAEALARFGVRVTPADLVDAAPQVRWWRPDLGSLEGVRVVRDIAYGDHPRHRLDLYLPDGAAPDVTVADGAAPDRRLPVVLQIHGGAWIIGDKRQQGQPLLRHLARQGVVGVAMNYRLAPRHRFPDQLVDVKRAIAWIRTHIGEHGGDPDRLVVTGGSAGGHLAALAALTADDERWQPGFADIDCSVAACIPFYPPTDLTNRHRIRWRTASMEPFLRRWVMPPRSRPAQAPPDEDLWELGSPISQVRADAPPFFVVQGSLDVLVWREETRAFVDALAAVSAAPTVLWEVPGAQHAFDIFTSPRCATAVAAVAAVIGSVTGVGSATPSPTESGGPTRR
ncbi:MAG: alpha/beta hydrolase, partial [Actinomyces sp.]